MTQFDMFVQCCCQFCPSGHSRDYNHNLPSDVKGLKESVGQQELAGRTNRVKHTMRGRVGAGPTLTEPLNSGRVPSRTPRWLPGPRSSACVPQSPPCAVSSDRSQSEAPVLTVNTNTPLCARAAPRQTHGRGHGAVLETKRQQQTETSKNW